VYAALALLVVNLDAGRPESPVAQDALTGGSHIVIVPLPADVDPGDLEAADPALRDRLHRWATQRVSVPASGTAERRLDLTVIFTDEQGRPILPDLDAARAALHARGELPASTDLTFTFNSPGYPWSSGDLAMLATALGDLYPAAKAVYGDPAFNITVNVRRDPTISYAGLYYPSLNEMVVRDLVTLDPLCHEMIHAFRDDAIIGLGNYEEGMTRAAEVEVFNRLPWYPHWNRHHSYYYDIYYDGLNAPAIRSMGGGVLWSAALALVRYQLSGYAWAKPLLEDDQFLSSFNRDYYARLLIDASVPYTEPTLAALAAARAPTVEGIAFSSWYGQQAVLNPAFLTGTFVYHRMNQYTIDVFTRLANGQEIANSGVTVQWQVRDYRDQLLDNGVGVTGGVGTTTFSPAIPDGYAGRLELFATAFTPETARSTAFAVAGYGNGVFGVVTSSDEGSLLLRPLDVAVAPVSTPVHNGGFQSPELETVRGRISVEYTDAAGGGFTRQFTKDASHYYLLLATPVRIEASDGTAAESGANTGEFTISRVGASASPLTVSYTIGGTASNGTDYHTIPSEVTIPAGEASATVTVTPIDDGSEEGAEDVTITLLPGVGYAVGLPAMSVVVIADDDGVPAVVSVAAVDASAVEAGPDPGSFRIVRTGSTASPLTVVYTVSGTATSGADYVSLPGSVPIPAGWSHIDVPVVPKPDATKEQNETVILTLAAGAGYTVGTPPAATVNITDGPDLTVASLVAPIGAVPGQTIAVSVKAKNSGTSAAPPTVLSIWLSANQTLGTSDALLANVAVPGLAPNASYSTNVMVLIPGDTPIAKHFVLANIDAPGTLPETNESNNLRKRALAVGPDYMVSSLSVVLVPGSTPKTLKVSDTTKNKGGPGFISTTTRFYLSKDRVVGPGDVLLGGRVVPPLAAGAASSCQHPSCDTSVVIPAGTPSGPWYIIAVADGLEVLAEISEKNNRKVTSVVVP
jgi:hypothetical protein